MSSKVHLDKLKRAYKAILSLVFIISLFNLLLTLGKILIELKTEVYMLDYGFLFFWFMTSVAFGYFLMRMRKR